MKLDQRSPLPWTKRTFAIATARKDRKGTCGVVKRGNYIFAWPASWGPPCWGDTLQLALASGESHRGDVATRSGSLQVCLFGWLWGKIAEELRERRHDLNYENMGQGLKSSPPAQLALPAPSTGDPKATKVTKTKVSAKKDTRPAAAASTEEPQRHTCALHAAGFCRFRVNCRNSHVGKPGWEEVRKAYSDAQKSKPKGAEKGSKGEGRERRKTTRAPKVALEFRQQWLRAASIVMVIEVEGRQAHGNPSVSFVTRPFFLGTCSWSCPFPSWPHWFHPSPTPMNKLESKLRLQWCTLRFRISRSIHWSFWEPLELPMASEVSGRCRTRDLAGKWWSHGQNF